MPAPPADDVPAPPADDGGQVSSPSPPSDGGDYGSPGGYGAYDGNDGAYGAPIYANPPPVGKTPVPAPEGKDAPPPPPPHSPPPPQLRKVISSSTSFQVDDIAAVDLAALKEGVIKSVSESAGGAEVEAVLVVVIVATYTFPAGLACTAIVEAYASSVGVSTALVSADCFELRGSKRARALLQTGQEEITLTVEIPEEDAALARAVAAAEPATVVTAMASELSVPVEDIANTQPPATEVVVRFVADVTDSEMGDADLDDLKEVIMGDMEEVAGDFDGVTMPEVDPIVDITPPPPPAVSEPEDDGDTDPPVGAIVGGVVGAAAFLGVAGFLVWKKCGAGAEEVPEQMHSF